MRHRRARRPLFACHGEGPRGATPVDTLRAVLFAIVLACAPAALAAGGQPAFATLTSARFTLEPADALPSAGASRTVTLPHAWERTDAGATGDGFYQLSWHLAAVPGEPQAVYLTAITVPALVAVNGRPVGGIALDARAPRSFEQGQFLRIPPDLLHAGDNTITVHLRARQPDVAGLGPVLAGNAQAVRDHSVADLALRTFGPAAMSVATFTVGLFIVVLWLRRRDAGYALFGSAAMLWSVHTLATLLPQPLFPQPHWWIAWHTIYLTFVALLCLFCVRFAGLRWHAYRRIVVGYAAATPPVLYVAQALGAGIAAAAVVRLGAIGLVLVALAAVARYAARMRNLESMLLLATGAVSSAFAVHDWLASQDPLDLRPVWLVPYAAVAFLTLVAYILIDRFLRALNQAERTNLELERRVEEKSVALRLQLAQTQHARDAAETANRAKSSFLAAASHDLRQPLHALGMFSQALAEHVHDADGAALAQRIATSVTALETLFSALLDVSKLDAGAIAAEPRDLAVRPLLGRLVDEFMPQALERGLRLVMTSADATVHSDPVLLERILRNLLSNAVRHTDAGGVLIACRRRGPMCSLEVWDTGTGIPREERGRIFEEFYQVPHPGRDRARGLGLGLSIVRRLAGLLGHDVTMDSREGRGSVFRVRVPAGRGAVSDIAPADDPVRRPIAGRTVLVIDDEADVRDGVVRLLGQWGCSAIAVADGEAACDACRTGAVPDALVADYRLGGGMDGLASIAAIRALVAREVPAVLVSGESDPAALARIKASGIVLLHKPLPPARLRSVLAHLFASAAEEAAAR